MPRIQLLETGKRVHRSRRPQPAHYKRVLSQIPTKRATVEDLLKIEAPTPCRVCGYRASNDRPHCACSNEHQVYHAVDCAKVPLGCDLSDENHGECIDACAAYSLEDSENDSGDWVRINVDSDILRTYSWMSDCASPHASDAIVKMDRLINNAGFRPVISLSLANTIRKPEYAKR